MHSSYAAAKVDGKARAMLALELASEINLRSDGPCGPRGGALR